FSDTAKLDSELIISHVTHLTKSYLYTWPENDILAQDINIISDLISTRKQGKSIAHIISKAEFWDLTFKVSDDTLSPRPDTETIIEFILDQFDINNKYSILDLGTGTGAIAVTLAKLLRKSNVTATDISNNALSIAQENSLINETDNIRFIESNWFSNLDQSERYDIIISNPPYIDFNDPEVEKNVRTHEPGLALFSKNNGLFDLFLIIENAKYFLNSNGTLILEHGHKQGIKVSNKLRENGYSNILSHNDINGIHRVTSATI
ncbi:peptide chain release factor N(5)-glutamine methyltransferase, partial [Francisellaceae bacterium]|nr:peptide chain release factor N(5)-glutamine methyltransferase [Francisellaceae bacterium]